MLTEVDQRQALTFEQKVQAQPADVYRAFTHTGALRDWLCNAAQVDGRAGGRIYLWWNDGYYTAGTFTQLARDESLAFTWRGPDDAAPSSVRVSLREEKGSTAVTLTHTGEASERVRRLWEEGLENLASVVERGIDLRFARRPMFGLTGADEVNAEAALRLGLPATEGLRLTGLVEGAGAHAAGLAKDDVVVELGGRPVTGFQSLLEVLQQHQAGDRVPVAFYRGNERRTLTVELSSRPQADLPPTGKGLAERLREMYSVVDAELDDCFRGVSDEQAEYRPAPGGWNAKEIVGHLIAVEQDTQTWVVCLLEDRDVETPFHDNFVERVSSFVAGSPSLAGVIEELKRSEAVTVAIVESLPERVTQHRHAYNQLAVWLTGFESHHREHFAEIRALLEKAKSA
jgi:uncharacterized protein YndB with AHSA1/START domain